MRPLVLVAVWTVSVVASAGCAGKPKTAVAPPAELPPVQVVMSPATPKPGPDRAEPDPYPEAVPAPTVSPLETTGVPACDSYILMAQSVLTCETAVPATMTEIRRTLSAMREAAATWRTLPLEERTRAQADAAPGCAQAALALQLSAADMGCPPL